MCLVKDQYGSYSTCCSALEPYVSDLKSTTKCCELLVCSAALPVQGIVNASLQIAASSQSTEALRIRSKPVDSGNSSSERDNESKALFLNGTLLLPAREI
jgi:hypothetical protein